jgi:hypothetical protein
VVITETRRESSLAAKLKRQLAPLKRATSTPKTRVWSFENTPSGRPCADLDLSWENAMGSVQYTYRNASGRAEWLSRDPIGINGGINLYGYVGNGPINLFDPYGLNGWWAAAGAALGALLSAPVDAAEDVPTFGAGVVANPATSIGMTAAGAVLGGMIDNAINGNSMSMSGTGSGAGSGSGNCPNNKAGNLKAKTNSQLDADGIDAEAVKEDFVGNSGGQYNVSVDGDGNVTLTPVQPGGGENVPTGLNYSQLPDFYPAGG